MYRHDRSRRWPIAAMALLVLCLAGPTVRGQDTVAARGQEVAPASDSAQPWRVLILDSVGPGDTALQTLFDGVIRAALMAGAARRIEFSSEGEDALHLKASGYEAELVAHLKRKYEGRRPDVIVTVLPDALGILERNRQKLWPETPGVFFGVPDDTPYARAPSPRMTGVAICVDLSGTLALALRLQPHLRGEAHSRSVTIEMDLVAGLPVVANNRVLLQQIETHGGKIWAENNPVGGATFRFVLPAAAGSPHGVSVRSPMRSAAGRGRLEEPGT